MPAKDDFDPAQALPRFLVVKAEQDDVPDEAVAPSRASKIRLLIITAAAAGIAVLAIGNPMALVAEVSALLAGHSTPQLVPIQSAADAPALIAVAAADAQDLPQDELQNLPPAASDAPARAEVAAPEPVAREPAEKAESSETLFSQFQAWAAAQDAQKKQSEAEQPVADAPASIVQEVPAAAAKNVRARHRHVQRREREPVRATVRNARAEVRTQNVRRQVPQAQGPRTERPPVQDPRAQDAAVQEGQTGFMGIFGQRN
jgi:hypothetical protein